ncbi:MAG TPA: four helix bundle protein [Bdellovibrio sp.]|nr:four helix bundle protein [Bdellovibrio sp.]
MKNFRTYELACEFYQKTETLNLSGHLRDQLLRAASSIPLNLAEGNAKSSVKEKKRFYQIAYGSLKECQAIFQISRVRHKDILDCANHLGACLYKLQNSEITVVSAGDIK